MKYFTKEWYNLCQNTTYHFGLRADKRAESFSDEYFKKLYKKTEAEYLSMMEEVNNVKFEDIYPEEFIWEPMDDYVPSAEELEQLRKQYYEDREAAREAYETMDRDFDAASEKRKFRRMWKEKISEYEKELPGEILDKVADIRVLALEKASAEVKGAITAFCKQNDRSINKTLSDYRKYYKKAFAKGEPHFAEGLHLHDCDVLSCRKSGKNVVMDFDNSGGFTDTSKVVFRNAKIVCMDAPLRGAWWLYDEIYKTDEGYEIHALLQKKELVYFTITCDDVEVYCD